MSRSPLFVSPPSLASFRCAIHALDPRKKQMVLQRVLYTLLFPAFTRAKEASCVTGDEEASDGSERMCECSQYELLHVPAAAAGQELVRRACIECMHLICQSGLVIMIMMTTMTMTTRIGVNLVDNFSI